MAELGMSPNQQDHGPPYVPMNATPGQHPNVRQDVAASAVFLFLYIVSAVCHQATFQTNRRKGHKFLMSWAMFGFAMARFGTLIFRIAWACRPYNGSVALTATIFVFLGVLVIYCVVLLLSVRTLRARQPTFGWNPWLDNFIKANYWALLVVVLVVIPFGILSGYTKDEELLNACAWIEKVGVLYFFLLNLIAPVLYFLALFMPRPKDVPPENFGTGSMRAKLIILGVVLFFTVFISGFRFGVAWSPYRPLSDPAWYDSRAAFYIIELGFELVITFTLIFTRFDRRFWIPNGSKQPGDYSRIDPDGKEHAQIHLQHQQEKSGAQAEETS
ncbi:hypothetical protein M409DRAFT_30913 [Zasmidium cellare ATCC 36951]|uniref:Uncharacterized protein n=1 Tax=Zasmidium cellare ATCC 36951 TaxID=1080233 RepID=A0A6A6BYU0_ZASCE|nr:uncharacterized protein M409DRAFT_30913 [Zasmidium cellare ATCC 36951]KAF2158586.1 hypothetical protein M409DRAFT_30913 [Zasmidium cellare ATCC 36951]